MRMIKQLWLSLRVLFVVIVGILLLLYITTPSLWGDVRAFLIDEKDFLESLSYVVAIVLSIWAAIWATIWWFFPQKDEAKEPIEPSQEPQFGQPKLPKDKFKLVRDHYLAWVSSHHNRAGLHGLEDLKKSAKTQTLDTIYTSLQVHHREKDETIRDVARQVGQQAVSKVDMDQLLLQNQHIAIIGGAGTGKTTYLDIVANTLARALRGENVEAKLTFPDPVPVPFVAPLRFWNVYRDMCAQQSNKSLDDAEHGTLIGFLFWYLRTNYDDFEAAKDFFDDLLEHGDVLLMFDGLDEVVEASERKIVRDQITRLLNHPLYKRHRCLVTAREAGYKDAPFGDEFLRCDIQPMSQEQIQCLVSRWCACLPDMEANAEQQILTIIERMNKEREEKGQALLIATPLMVTMIVTVRYSQRELPKERAKLYDVVVKIILQKQYGADADVHGAREALITWGGPPDKQREWLSHLAFHMQQRGTGGAVADESTVREILTTALAERGETERVKPFVQAMRKRGGLFEERGEQFRFMHLTFQEFLAAEYLSSEWPAHQAQLAKWVTDSWWRETLLLTIGKLDSPTPFRQRKAFIDALLDLKTSAEAQVAAAEVVAQGLLDLREPDNILQERAQERLAKIFTEGTLLNQVSPPLRANAGIALAQIGDPRPNVMTVDGMEFCYVPAGPFWMGSDDGEEDAKPLHQVDIPYGYWMGRYPVSNAQFEEFVQAGGYGMKRFWTEAEVHGFWEDGQIRDRTRPRNYGSPYNLPNHPVVGVTWYEAVAFMRWLTEKWGSEVRLPKEREWEKAARGGLQIPTKVLICPVSQLSHPASLPMQTNPLSQRDYPWGNDIDPIQTNYDNSRIGHPNTLGSFSKGESPYGCEEMSGNVQEWVQSRYVKYEDYPEDEIERLDMYDGRIIKGGSYYESSIFILIFSRRWGYPNKWLNNVGFRVLRPPHL